MIALIGAMEIEVAELTKLVKINNARKINDSIVYEVTYNDKELLIMLSGVGKVNAAMNTAILLNIYDVSKVINFGVAAGLKDSLSILDIVVSTSCVQHDFDTSAIDGIEGIGIKSLIDKDLLDKTIMSLNELDYPYSEGLLATGDQFIANKDDFKKIIKNFPDVLCVDMEGASICNVCNAFKIPVIVIRSISDIVFDDNSNMDFIKFAQIASKRNCEVILKIIDKL